MELTIGVVGDFWTPRAAQQALWVAMQMTPKKGAELFERVGNMDPSKSSLDRLPKIIAERWEDDREAFEKALRDGLQIPEGTVSIAVSLDGVLAPIDGANSPTEVRARAAEDGRLSKGPAGYREAGCATVSFCDEKGELLGAIRMARAPEPKKKTLKEMLAAEIAAILRREPALKLVKVADGATDNWQFLSSDKLPDGEEVVDFFRERAPARGDRRRLRRWHARDAVPLRDAARHASRRRRRRRKSDPRAQAPREQAPAQNDDRASARLLPQA
jgi:hypothetical protein